MFVSNPSDEKIRELIELSEYRAAKWIKDNENGDIFYWTTVETTHAEMAAVLHIEDYQTGVAVAKA
jgi:hypothetical protein